jgi:hypothetical protein
MLVGTTPDGTHTLNISWNTGSASYTVTQLCGTTTTTTTTTTTLLAPPVIPVTGAGGPDIALIPVTGVDLAAQTQSHYFELAKISMLVGMGCFSISIVLDRFPKKKKG